MLSKNETLNGKITIVDSFCGSGKCECLSMKKLSELSETDFERLKASGMLWEFYPEAPEFYKEIQKVASCR